MGKGSKTVTSSTAPNPEAMKAYLNVINRAQNTAQTPYEAYSGQMVAGFNPMQQQAFDQIGNFASNAGTKSLPDILSQYYSPYTDEVVNKTMENIRVNDAQQQERLKSDAIAQGAWGGVRPQLAANDLTRNQNLASGQVIAGLRQAGFNTASQNALADQQRLNQERLAGIGALTAGGAQQQQNEQDRLAAQYNLFKEGKEYPFKTDQWLAGIVGGIGPGMGGTNTQQIPQPSMLQQIAGLGMTGLGLYNAGAFRGLGSSFGKGSSVGSFGGGFAEGGAVNTPAAANPLESIRNIMPLFHSIKSRMKAGFAKGGEVDVFDQPAGSLPYSESLFDAPAAGFLPPPPPALRTTEVPNAPGVFDEENIPGFAMPVSAVRGEAGIAPGAAEIAHDPWLAVAAAGLGTLASKSLNAGQAIGEGGLAGLNYYSGQRKAKNEAEALKLRNKMIEQNAARLDQQARLAEQRLQHQDKMADIAARRQEALENREQWVNVGTSEDGLSVIQMNQRTGEIRNAPLVDKDSKPIRLKPKTSELTAGDRKIIVEGEDKILNIQSVISNLDEALKLNDKSYSGPLAKQRGYFGSFVEEEGVNTQKIENLVSTQALQQLKSVFGGNPTEGERKIMLEVQGSVNQAPEVRADIWRRAKALAERRMKHEQDKIDQIRGGTYYKPQSATGLKPAPAEILQQAKAKLQEGVSREDIVRRLKENGFTDEGL